MIAPHDGQELELMLLGKKCLAAFCDFVPFDGCIYEEIIPEKKFHPYVQSGKIIRIESEFRDINKKSLRYVCFSLPDSEWRGHSYIYIRKHLHQKIISYTDSIDELLGHLLDYSQNDIDDFLKQ